MERTVISWTPTNWATVLLMVWVGGLALACVARLAHKFRGASDNG